MSASIEPSPPAWRIEAPAPLLAKVSRPTSVDRESNVSGPFVFIATNRLREGSLEAERARVPGLVEFVSTREPQVLAFNEYASEDGREVAVVQVHRDAASMELHLALIREHAANAYAGTIERTESIQVFGTPSEAILRLLREQAGAGVELSVKPLHLGGFTRPVG